MVVAFEETEQELAPLRWSNERYLALVESGVIEEGRGVELIDGQVMTTMPQGKLHYLICRALQRLFESIGGTHVGFSTQPTIVVAEGEVYDPEFVLLRPEYAENDLPRASDVLLVVEVSVTSRRTDLSTKKAAYARAGIPEYWVVDAAERGVWAFTDPAEGGYRDERFVAVGESLTVPSVGASIDVGSIFPAA